MKPIPKKSKEESCAFIVNSWINGQAYLDRGDLFSDGKSIYLRTTDYPIVFKKNKVVYITTINESNYYNSYQDIIKNLVKNQVNSLIPITIEEMVSLIELNKQETLRKRVYV